MKGGQRAGTAVSVVLEADVRERLVRTAASAQSEVRAVLRAKILLAARGTDGLRDAPRPGRPRSYGLEVRVAIVATAGSAPPHPEATWSHLATAQKVADTCFAPVSASQVGRILADLTSSPTRYAAGSPAGGGGRPVHR